MCLAVYRRVAPEARKRLFISRKRELVRILMENISELSAVRLRAKRPSSLPLSSTGSSSQIFAHSTETC